MTVKEYNEEFLPKITQASSLVNLLETIITHSDIGKTGHEEVMRVLKIYGWSKEVISMINTALEYYRVHEGIEKLD